MSGSGDIITDLRAVCFLRFESRSGKSTGWDGIGTGTVTVTQSADKNLVFEEKGVWRAHGDEASDIPFQNVFRWSMVGLALRLEHLRFGWDDPVFLFDMIRGANGTWHSERPHLCGADRYSGRLTREAEELTMEWSIVGPHKQETIHYRYW